ncbi:MAG: SDR family oxidoreductase [Chloroflexota bacterium]|nr:SDR family oxidoreductase [Chloroflexota bacterium]
MGGSVKALVTGGGGFIGSNLVERLLAEGYDVRVLDNFATGDRENLKHLLGEIELVEGDIQSYERVHNAVVGRELVFHLAALPSVPRSIQDPLTSNATNVIGTLNVLLASRDAGVQRIVYASSSSLYGPTLDLPKREDMPLLPIAPYAVSKLAGEGYCRSFTQVYGLDTVALRYFNVFGPRQDPLSQYAAVIPRFVMAFQEDRSPVVFGNGEQSRDFTYVDNAVDANLRAALANDVAGEAFNIACGERISLNEILAELRELTGKEIVADYSDARPGEVPHSLADISKARQALSYEPAVNVRQGLRTVFEWYTERRRLIEEAPTRPT